MQNNKETFEYTYSAEQQAEIERIKRKYMPKEDDKLEQLRKLDASVNTKGQIVSLTLGIIGTLTFGASLSMILVVGISLLPHALLMGVPGTLMMIMAYPAYKKVTEQERKRIAPQILSLTEELGQQ